MIRQQRKILSRHFVTDKHYSWHVLNKGVEINALD